MSKKVTSKQLSSKVENKGKKPNNKILRNGILFIALAIVVTTLGLLILNRQTQVKPNHHVNFLALATNSSLQTRDVQLSKLAEFVKTLPSSVGCQVWNGSWNMVSNTKSGDVTFTSDSTQTCNTIVNIDVPFDLQPELQQTLFLKEWNTLKVLNWMAQHPEVKNFSSSARNLLGDGLAFILLDRQQKALLRIGFSDNEAYAWSWNGSDWPSCEVLDNIHFLATNTQFNPFAKGDIKEILKDKGCIMPDFTATDYTNGN